MTRLIDAWKLCEYANNIKDKCVDANDIMRFPAEDAVPVKHGRWIIADYEEPRRYGCSECHRMVWQLENYCPSCGARMDGDV